MESINLPFAPHIYIYLSIDLNPPCEKPTLLPIIYGLIIILGGWKNGGEEEINVGVAFWIVFQTNLSCYKFRRLFNNNNTRIYLKRLKIRFFVLFDIH